MLKYYESLSEQYVIGDKWDTTGDFGANGTAYLGFQGYATLPCCGGSSPSAVPQDAPAAASTRSQPVDPNTRLPMGLPFSPAQTHDKGEVLLVPDLSGGLTEYINRTRGLSRALVAEGPAIGVLTFTRPLSFAEVDRWAQAGVSIESVEAVGPEVSPGIRWTFGSAYDPLTWTRLDEMALEEGTTILGVTSAQVIVRDAPVLDELESSVDVLVLDLSLEHAVRTWGNDADVVMNDLYWYHAGWVE